MVPAQASDPRSHILNQTACCSQGADDSVLRPDCTSEIHELVKESDPPNSEGKLGCGELYSQAPSGSDVQLNLAAMVALQPGSLFQGPLLS